MHSRNLKKDKIADTIRQRIVSGFYPVAHHLPGEIPLSREFHVARETLRNALSILESEGLLERIHGKGNYVRYSSRSKGSKKLLCIAETSGIKSTTAALLHRFEEKARVCGVDLEFCNYHLIKAMGPLQFADFLSKRSISGIFMIASNFYGTEEILSTLDNLSIPVVLTMASRQDYLLTGFSSCAFNIRNAWGMALEHLRAQGHRRVGIIAVPDAGEIRGFRPEELKEFMTEIGMDTSPELFVQDPQLNSFHEKRDQLIRKEVDRMMDLPRPPTALICHTSAWAPPVYEALEKRHLMPGKDIAVMGFMDNNFDSSLITPKISSIEIDFDRLIKSVFMLLNTADEWLRKGKPYPYMEIPFQLIVKESTAMKYHSTEREKS